jgi:hypothetical protein
MSIFDKKYLLGGRQGVQATVDLNFLTGTLDPRITFSRADTTPVASYTDASGVLRYGPTNQNALSVDNGTWTILGTGTRTANATVAPDGTTTGSLLAADATNGLHGFAFTAPTPNASTTYTLSAYIKAGTASKVGVDLRVGVNWTGGTVTTIFDLVAGTATPTLGGGTASITPVGNGWFRCSTTGTSNASGLTAQTSWLKVLSAAGVESFPGAGESAYFWGVQYEQGPATTYIPTTGAVKSGPRFDYDPATRVLRGLLIEEARTNLAFPSGDMTSVWTLTNTTVAAAPGTALDGMGVMNRLTDAAVTGFHMIGKNSTVVAATVYTFSIYAKAQQNQYLQVIYDDAGNGVYATFDLIAGTISGAVALRGTGTNAAATIQAVGNGVWRCSVTCATNSTTTGRTAALMTLTGNPGFAPSYAGNVANGLLVWGAQLEAGAFPTSYIPTVGATVTRAADAATLPLGSWYNATAGSWVADTIGILAASGSQRIVGSQAGAAPLQMVNISGAGSTYNGSVTLVVPAISGYAGSARWGMTYAPAGRSVTTNGAAPVTDALGIGAITIIALGSGAGGLNNYLNGTIRRVRYWAQALSATQLMSVTK